MSTISTTHRVSSLNLFIALAILLVAVLTFALAPSITSPKPALIPVTGNQNAYVDFLRGEKVIFANPAGVNAAIEDYHFGEKILDANVVSSDSAMETYRAGEKGSVPSVESVLVEYRQGEKNVK